MFKNVFQIIYERLNDPLVGAFCILYTQNKLINYTQVHNNVMNSQSWSNFISIKGLCNILP